MTILEMQEKIHITATQKGWWKCERNVGELLMLVVTEVAEAMECWREADMDLYFEKDGKPCGFSSELADVVIRVLDIAHSRGVDLGEVIEKKMAYNETRPYRHGGKRA